MSVSAATDQVSAFNLPDMSVRTCCQLRVISAIFYSVKFVCVLITTFPLHMPETLLLSLKLSATGHMNRRQSCPDKAVHSITQQHAAAVLTFTPDPDLIFTESISGT
jgi:hypothetical protein